MELPPPTKEEFEWLEKMLLRPKGCFDDQRRAFISDFSTLDLQAVPGSGKTTAILAKLLYLENHLPLDKDAGVLVLSHTNTAVDEIKGALHDKCPKLFSYPNYVGTIQSFVDNFLAAPYFSQKFQQNIIRIDNEAYDDAITRRFLYNIEGFSTEESKNSRYFLMGKKCLTTYRFRSDGSSVDLIDGINGKSLVIEKPKRGKNYQDFSIKEKGRIKSWLIKLKQSVMEKERVLHFDDAYFLAERYLQFVPEIRLLLQLRFKCVIVDEMQDMDLHQHQLVEKLFYEGDKDLTKLQRIGDKNQAIFNGSIQLDDVWKDRSKCLSISGSNRFSNHIANIIAPFATCGDEDFRINGHGEGSLRPLLLIYDRESIEKVIPTFLSLLTELKDANKIPDPTGHPIKIIAWNTVWREGRSNESNVRLCDYWPMFSRDIIKNTIDYPSLKSYFFSSESDDISSARIRKNILNSLLRILLMEDVKTVDGFRYTVTKVQEHLRLHDDTGGYYERFLQIVYDCIYLSFNEDKQAAYSLLKSYIPEFLAIFGSAIKRSKEFIEGDRVLTGADDRAFFEQREQGNWIDFNGAKIELSTVHSVKGQTLSCLLYVETAYHGTHESEFLGPQFLGEQFTDRRKRHREAARVAYVATSRASNFLCVAVERQRFEKNIGSAASKFWELRYV